MLNLEPDIASTGFGISRFPQHEPIRARRISRDSYLRGLSLLIGAQDRGLFIPEAKNELSAAGLSRKARERLFRLDSEELQRLADTCPAEKYLWDAYVTELQSLLSAMDRLRKQELFIGRPPFMGRPYVIAEQGSVLAKLTVLRWREGLGDCSISSVDLRGLLIGYGGGDILAYEFSFDEQAFGGVERPIRIIAARRFLELYRNELLMPPALESKSSLDEETRHLIENDDLSWMDDGGEQLMEDLYDMMQVKIRDVLPNFMSVSDWFIESRPAMDSNQVKRGWTFLEQRSREWHEQEIYWRYLDQIKGNPQWPCAIADNLEAWYERQPATGELKLFPLVSFKALKQESQAMHHCVVSHIEQCLGGRTRVFSVGDESGEKRIATFEINLTAIGWLVTEMQGAHNYELIGCMSSDVSPLAILARAVVDWYDKYAPNGYEDITACTI
jgi:hypothetical protein